MGEIGFLAPQWGIQHGLPLMGVVAALFVGLVCTVVCVVRGTRWVVRRFF